MPEADSDIRTRITVGETGPVYWPIADRRSQIANRESLVVAGL